MKAADERCLPGQMSIVSSGTLYPRIPPPLVPLPPVVSIRRKDAERVLADYRHSDSSSADISPTIRFSKARSVQEVVESASSVVPAFSGELCVVNLRKDGVVIENLERTPSDRVSAGCRLRA